MTPTRGTASGKAILFGEHAVVYGRPAIAVPVTEVEAEARFQPDAAGSGLTIVAPDIERQYQLVAATEDDPLAAIVGLTVDHLGTAWPVGELHVRSTIPLGRGLGSGAAISTAIVHALARHYGADLAPAAVSALVYEVEKLHHGTPSGIDNTVIAFEQPVYFIKNQPIERMRVGQPLTLVIADTGQTAATHEVVGDLRQRWQANPERYETDFDDIGAIVNRARQIIEQDAADVSDLGRLMNDNQNLLETLGISSPALQRLISAARQAGAKGAKLSGAGWGGNMIALTTDQTAEAVAQALKEAGAAQVIVTTIR